MVAIKNESEYNVAILSAAGKIHHVLPGEVFPDWASDKVTNPNVVGDQLIDDETRDARYQEELAALEAKYDKGRKGSKSDDGDGSKSDDGDGPPPQSGKGSGIDAWRDYALDHDVDVQEDWAREQIIEECQKAGIPV